MRFPLRLVMSIKSNRVNIVKEGMFQGSPVKPFRSVWSLLEAFLLKTPDLVNLKRLVQIH
jgi:hypothetical protein